jgi:serine/threonine protein phosphatase PrpC
MRNKAISDGFIKNDTCLAQQGFGYEFSGSTIVTVMVNGNKLVSANSGDSRAVIGSLKDKDYSLKPEESKALCVEENDRQWVAIPITRDHKPDDPIEKQRILERGGRIDSYKGKFGENVGPMRVWLRKESYPGLAMSRSIGDACAHSVGVVADPGKSKFKLGGKRLFNSNRDQRV